jgi:predicted MFS family arabinose efflux permease
MTFKRENWLLLTLAGIQFTHVLDFMIMMPLGPQFTRIFGINEAQFGLLVSAYTLAGGVSGLIASTVVERFGRKRLLLFLYGFFCLSAVACSLAPGYWTLMAARIAAGLFGGVLSGVSQTIVGDVIPFERRGRAMGIVMTSFSLASVAGVPAGLWLAGLFGWHAPFVAIAVLSAIFGVFAALTLPTLDAHVQSRNPVPAFRRIAGVLADANHRRAFGLTVLVMFGGFCVIPFLAINAQYGIGLSQEQIPYIYLFGGLGALATARWFGRLADRWGKVNCFRMLSVLAIAPTFAMTLMPHGAPLWLVLVTSTIFMALTSGRMIPSMAIVTSAAIPAVRGTFMTLNSSAQSAAMGLAALLGGTLISRDAAGHIQHYWLNAVVGTTASLLAIWLAGRLNLQPGTSGQKQAPTGHDPKGKSDDL